MQLRLSHKLFLLLAGLLAATLLAVTAVTVLDLRQGFSTYLQQRDQQRLRHLAAMLAVDIERDGTTVRLAADPLTIPNLLRRLSASEAVFESPDMPPPPPPPPPPRQGQPPPDMPPPAPPPPGMPPPLGPLSDRPPQGVHPQPGDVRMAIFAPDGRQWAGLLLPRGEPTMDTNVIVRGQVAAILRAVAAPPVPAGIEADFLHRQYRATATVALLMGLLTALAAWLAARAWVRPLQALQAATARIAAGDFAARVHATGNDELATALRDINAMAEALARLEATRRAWLAQISHELRTPLSVLRGETEALLDGVRPLNRAAAESLREEVARLTALVEDLHLLALSDLRALPCVFAEDDAAASLRRAAARFAARADAAGLTLLITSPDAPVPALWDPSRIDQLLANLLENSLRYTDAPGRIELGVEARGQHVVLTVQDSAPGVPPAQLAQLFQPLFRADASRSRAYGGAGLGLAVCAAIAAAHGGRIVAAGSGLGGLMVEVWLPREGKEAVLF